MELESHVRIEDCGSVWLLHPRTKAAREWLETHTDGHWWAGALAVEPRYLGDILDGLYVDLGCETGILG